MFKEFYYWMNYILPDTNDTPAFNSYLLICILQFFNIGTIFVTLAYVFKIDISVTKNTAVIFGLGFALLLSIINYFALYSKHKIIFSKYDKHQITHRRLRQIIFGTYVIVSVIIFFVAVANFAPQKP